ncbi:MAG: hypothetical protein KDI28_12310 [Pseudomonadales bacterium]|nr:hypothetical protein [Pseudomonadales bacterium]MCP5357826.1 hypothetical protein [Pseudomonadales bacterium]
MKAASSSRFLGILLLLALPGLPVQAQDALNLFEAVETPAGFGSGNANQAQQQRALPGTPTFTLLGTSRIGGKYRATLQSGDEQIIQVEYRGEDSVPIPGYVGYRLVSVGSREVAISYPADAPCVAAEDKGVRCGADGLATLSLRTAAPVVVAKSEAVEEPAADTEQATEQNENPFAAALRAAAQNEAATNGRGRNAPRLEPRRIPPEEVPPGMRVVRTPFGDRLVEL